MGSEYSRVIAAVDNGSTLDAVVRKAVEIAASAGAHLRFAHVCDSRGLTYDAPSWDEPIRRFKEKTAVKVNAKLAEMGKDPGDLDWDIIMLDPDKGYSELDASISSMLVFDIIKPYGPDLVICGERGLSRIRYALLGSVSKYIIQNVNCDVMIAR